MRRYLQSLRRSNEFKENTRRKCFQSMLNLLERDRGEPLSKFANSKKVLLMTLEIKVRTFTSPLQNCRFKRRSRGSEYRTQIMRSLLESQFPDSRHPCSNRTSELTFSFTPNSRRFGLGLGGSLATQKSADVNISLDMIAKYF